MSLATRIGRLENAAEVKGFRLPDMVISFIEPVLEDGGRMRPGRCVGRILSPAFGNQSSRAYGWIDEDNNPIPPPEWTREKTS